MEIDNTDASSNENACEIKVTFPTSLQAEQALKVLSVDPEPSTRVVKSFRIENEEGSTDEKKACMVVRFESKEIKMLRVAVSSFYDYLTLVIKTMQEFGPNGET